MDGHEYEQLKQLAEARGVTLSDFARVAFDLLEKALDVQERELHLVSVDQKRRIVEEHVLPF